MHLRFTFSPSEKNIFGDPYFNLIYPYIGLYWNRNPKKYLQEIWSVELTSVSKNLTKICLYSMTLPDFANPVSFNTLFSLIVNLISCLEL